MPYQSSSISRFEFINPFKAKQPQMNHSISKGNIDACCTSRFLANIALIQSATCELPKQSNLSSLPAYDDPNFTLPGLAVYNEEYLQPAYDKNNAFLPSYVETEQGFPNRNELKNNLDKIAVIKDAYLSIKNHQHFHKSSSKIQFLGKKDAIDVLNKHRLSNERNKLNTNKNTSQFRKYNKEVHDLAIKYFKFLSNKDYKHTFEGKEVNQHIGLSELSTELNNKLAGTKSIRSDVAHLLLQAAYDTLINNGYKQIAQLMQHHGLILKPTKTGGYLPQVEYLDTLKEHLKQHTQQEKSPIYLQLLSGQNTFAAVLQPSSALFKFVNEDNSVLEFHEFGQFIRHLENTVKTSNLRNSLPVNQVIFQQYHKSTAIQNQLDA